MLGLAGVAQGGVDGDHHADRLALRPAEPAPQQPRQLRLPVQSVHNFISTPQKSFLSILALFENGECIFFRLIIIIFSIQS